MPARNTWSNLASISHSAGPNDGRAVYIRSVQLSDLLLTAEDKLFDWIDPWQQFHDALSAAAQFDPDAVVMTDLNVIDIFDDPRSHPGAVGSSTGPR